MKNFEVYHKNELVSKVQIKDNIVLIDRVVLHPLKQLFYKDKMTIYELSEVLKSRCWDENRMNLNLYLEKLGLKEYNPFLICKKTHGVKYDDFLWFKYEGEDITFDDIRVR